ncbi:MAG: CehA/McbA family metallohydrolase [Bacteriovoracia bacterium]
MRYTLILLILLLGSQPSLAKWYKGNTHTHTNHSGDGDGSPGVVAKWYYDHGYDFVVLTDHNTRTSVRNIEIEGATRPFLVISGEEITQWMDAGDRPNRRRVAVHVNGLWTQKTIEENSALSVSGLIQKNVRSIQRQGGISQLNHPNYRYSVSAQDLLFVRDLDLFELFNSSSETNNEGDTNHPSTEEIWDEVLSNGKMLYGVAGDDAHNFMNTVGNPDIVDYPGGGWIVVKADRLDGDELYSNIKTGNFYASNGVVLKELKYNSLGIEIEIEPKRNVAYTVAFIGENGSVLKTVSGCHASYVYSGKEKYVRARVSGSDGKKAWTQPQFLR